MTLSYVSAVHTRTFSICFQKISTFEGIFGENWTVIVNNRLQSGRRTPMKNRCKINHFPLKEKNERMLVDVAKTILTILTGGSFLYNDCRKTKPKVTVSGQGSKLNEPIKIRRQAIQLVQSAGKKRLISKQFPIKRLSPFQ